MSRTVEEVDKCISLMLRSNMSLIKQQSSKMSYRNGLLDNVYILCALVHTYSALAETREIAKGLVRHISMPKNSLNFQLVKYNACLDWVQTHDTSLGRLQQDLGSPRQIDLGSLQEEQHELVCSTKTVAANLDRSSAESIADLMKLQTNTGILCMALDSLIPGGSREHVRKWTEVCLLHADGLVAPLQFEKGSSSLQACARERVYFLTHIVFVASSYGTKPILGYDNKLKPTLLRWVMAFSDTAKVDSNIAVYCEIVASLFQLGVDLECVSALHLVERILEGQWRPKAVDSYSACHDTVCCLMLLCHW